MNEISQAERRSKDNSLWLLGTFGTLLEAAVHGDLVEGER
jgi:hypothetical protein